MLIAGVDEAGRGPLAGPVLAAAALLTERQREKLLSAGLTDSKKLSPAKRVKLFNRMIDMGVVWRAHAASSYRIDRMNILQASLWAMGRSVLNLGVRPDRIIVDGTFIVPDLEYPQEAIPRADMTVAEVAAASIFAKVLRDRAMIALDRVFPEYGFAGHKGYPTKAHYEVLMRIGPCCIHRKSFNLHC